MKTLLIDNYDSFTFNLYQLIAEVNGEAPIVVRNDGAEWRELEGWGYDNIVVSPGPGRPERPGDFGVCADAIRHASVPLLGVCLGHQGLGHLAGGTVVHAPEVMHGRLSAVEHDGSGLFAGIPQGFEVVRYHSLCVSRPLPDGLEMTAWTHDGVVMGMRDVYRPRFGVQFHPESICTSHGRRLMENFRDLTRAASHAPSRRRRADAPRTIVPSRSPSRGTTGVGGYDEVLVQCLDAAPDPERVFVELFGDDVHAWWLDSSALGRETSRFSFMGGGEGPLAYRVYYDVESRELTVVQGGTKETRRGSIFEFLRRELDRAQPRVPADVPFDLDSGFVGYFGYELKAECGGSQVHQSSMPDAMFQFADRLIVFDHHDRCTYLVCLVDDRTRDEGRTWLDAVTCRLDSIPSATADVRSSEHRAEVDVDFFLSRDHQTYIEDIARCKQYLVDGETYEVCLTNKIKTDFTPDALELYGIVRRVNPAPFSAFLRDEARAVLCSSPERFLRVGRDRVVEAKPIKGTIRRGATDEEDRALAEELRTDEKSRAENLMITDLLRNDLGLVCDIGTVHVPHLFSIESYETVHQLVSTVRGRLRQDLAATDCIEACFPGGSMTGAPKKRTMEIIDDLEEEARGVYSGAIGYLGLGGGADLNIVIRTIVLDGQETSIGVGGAIVMQSDAEDEYDEIMLKGRAPMEAIVRCANAGPGVGDEGGGTEGSLARALHTAIARTRGARSGRASS